MDLLCAQRLGQVLLFVRSCCSGTCKVETMRYMVESVTLGVEHQRFVFRGLRDPLKGLEFGGWPKALTPSRVCRKSTKPSKNFSNFTKSKP